ncbi:hypothetical protein LTR49_005655 [Elasticomyces elasticus]|nr:hypothetical protein LTR49_005655 [Elasticomyces elasticus]KAK5749769.1 hypothetical protein LTS12_020197 [Elasticomyces elasticus]
MVQESDTPSLMTITPELRNAICELYLLNEINEVRIAPSGAIVNQPGLLAVCRQLRTETLPVFQDMAPNQSIVIKVHNFDFTGLISFINALDVEQENTVHKNGNLLITLDLDEEKTLDVAQAVDGLLVWKAHCDAKLRGPTPSNDAGGRIAQAEYCKEARKHVQCVGYQAFKSVLQTVKYLHYMYGARWVSPAKSTVEFRGHVDYEKWKAMWSLWEHSWPHMVSAMLFMETLRPTARQA